MPLRSTFAALVAILPMTATAQTLTTQQKDEINTLVTKLGSPSYREREAAEKQLAAFGARALPALRAALPGVDNAEGQRRLEVMIDRYAVDAIIKPTRVSVSANDRPIKLVLKDLCKQAGYGLMEGNAKMDARITMDLKDVPLWEAIEKVTAGQGLTTQFMENDNNSLYVQSDGSANAYVALDGPFRFSAWNISSNRNVQLGGLNPRMGNRNHEYLSLGIQFHAEPKAPVVSVGMAVTTKAVDDTGTSLVTAYDPDNMVTSYRYGRNSYRSLNQNFAVNLGRPDRRATTIKELTGKVTLTMLRDTRPEIEFDKILEPGKKQGVSAALEIDIDEVTGANGSYSVTLTMRTRQANNRHDYGWWSGAYQRLQMIDDQGIVWSASGINQQHVSEGTVTMKTSFQAPNGKKAGKPVKLVLTEWITVDKDYEFSFKDVPLP